MSAQHNHAARRLENAVAELNAIRHSLERISSVCALAAESGWDQWVEEYRHTFDLLREELARIDDRLDEAVRAAELGEAKVGTS